MKQEFYVMGDIHGDFKPIRELVRRNFWLLNEKDLGIENVLILLGDAGINFFFDYRDENLKKKLGTYPFTYFVIRGNHDARPMTLAEKNLKEWHIEEYLCGYVLVEDKYPYIKYAMDYVSTYLIPIDDNCVLSTAVFPGAYSVDKHYRLRQGWTWFEDEQLSEKERKAGNKILDMMSWKCDLVLSHTCPIIYEPTDLFIPELDQSMIDKTMERYLGEIEYKLDYKLWLFGHYHGTHKFPKNGNRQVIMLYNSKAIRLSEWVIDKGYVRWY